MNEIPRNLAPTSVPVTTANGGAPLIEVRGLKKHFPIHKGFFSRVAGQVFAVDGVSFHILPGETLGLVGESGCGKSTVGRTLLKLLEPTGGSIHFKGKDITALPPDEMLAYRQRMQMIYQDPYASLNPRMTSAEIVGEPLVIHSVGSKSEQRERVASLFQKAGLRAELMNAYPHEFSGGQRQRIGIARALALNPELIVGDEPVSALDVSIQAQIINLLIDLQDELKLAYLFVAHDLAVVQHISHRVAVMYLGRIVEMTDKKRLFDEPLHPYTHALLSAVPIPKATARKRERVILTGDVPSPINPPKGCHFHTRCPFTHARCKAEAPLLREVTPGHVAACHLHDNGPRFPLSKPGEVAKPVAAKAAVPTTLVASGGPLT
jgi:peptide/nickel transport system ATP-binding protein/oligopeptide transport system ATP-binding protein